MQVAFAAAVPVAGFPTIKYFPRGSAEPVDYKGGRKAKSFITFLKKKVGKVFPS